MGKDTIHKKIIVYLLNNNLSDNCCKNIYKIGLRVPDIAYHTYAGIMYKYNSLCKTFMIENADGYIFNAEKEVDPKTFFMEYYGLSDRDLLLIFRIAVSGKKNHNKIKLRGLDICFNIEAILKIENKKEDKKMKFEEYYSDYVKISEDAINAIDDNLTSVKRFDACKRMVNCIADNLDYFQKYFGDVINASDRTYHGKYNIILNLKEKFIYYDYTIDGNSLSTSISIDLKKRDDLNYIALYNMWDENRPLYTLIVRIMKILLLRIFYKIEEKKRNTYELGDILQDKYSNNLYVVTSISSCNFEFEAQEIISYLNNTLDAIYTYDMHKNSLIKTGMKMIVHIDNEVKEDGERV